MGVGTLRRHHENRDPKLPNTEATEVKEPLVMDSSLEEMDLKELKAEAEKRLIDWRKLKLTTKPKLIEVLSDIEKSGKAAAASRDPETLPPEAEVHVPETERRSVAEDTALVTAAAKGVLPEDDRRTTSPDSAVPPTAEELEAQEKAAAEAAEKGSSRKRK